MRSTKQPRYNPLFPSRFVYFKGAETIGTRLYREACLWLSLSQSRARSTVLLGKPKMGPREPWGGGSSAARLAN